MRTIYIDSEYKCHPLPADGRSAVETDFFDGKCDSFVEGYRFIPDGMSFFREDGKVFRGEMIAPWMPIVELDAAQREYERQMLAEYAEALKVLGVEV